MLNAAGSIAASGSPITATELNEMLREVEEDPSVKAVVLRIDSPGASMEPCLFRSSLCDRPDSLSSTKQHYFVFTQTRIASQSGVPVTI